jgi:uncharacterized protein YqgC (DUF456 family)
MSTGGVTLIALLMAAGLIGTIIPLIPGLPIVWGAALLYGLSAGFDGPGWPAIVLITLLAVGGMIAGFVLPHRQLAAGGAPRATVVAAVVGGVAGFFLIPVVGLPIGAVAAAYLAERARTGNGRAAWTSTKNLIKGFGLGILVELAAGMAMVAVWIAWVMFD